MASIRQCRTNVKNTSTQNTSDRHKGDYHWLSIYGKEQLGHSLRMFLCFCPQKKVIIYVLKNMMTDFSF